MSEVLQKAALAKEAAAEMVMKTTAEKNEALNVSQTDSEMNAG